MRCNRRTIRDVLRSCYSNDPSTNSERLSQQEIIRFTPRWVSVRHVLALSFWFIAAAFSLAAFGRYWAIAIAVGTYILMEIAGFLFPPSNHPYYVRTIHRTFCNSLATAERFGDRNLAADYHERIRQIEFVYAKELSTVV